MARRTDASGRKRPERGRDPSRLASEKPSGREDDLSTRAERSVAAYIADLAAQLETMALAAGLDLAAYFLAMARNECETQAGETAEQDAPRVEPEPPSEDEGQSPYDYGREKS